MNIFSVVKKFNRFQFLPLDICSSHSDQRTKLQKKWLRPEISFKDNIALVRHCLWRTKFGKRVFQTLSYWTICHSTRICFECLILVRGVTSEMATITKKLFNLYLSVIIGRYTRILLALIVRISCAINYSLVRKLQTTLRMLDKHKLCRGTDNLKEYQKERMCIGTLYYPNDTERHQ